MKLLKRFICTVLLFFFIFVQLFADPKQISDFFFYYSNPYTFKNRTLDLLPFANGGGGGVLFRAVAYPEDKSLLNQPITLTYNSNGNDGSRLRVTFGGKTIIVSDLYDWMLLPVAAFADTPYYNCVTLLAKPREEWEVNRKLYDDEFYYKSIYFAEYHPAFINTLVGLNLLLVDSIFIDENARDIPYTAKEMKYLIGYNTNDIQDFNSKRSNASLDYIWERLLDEEGEQKYDSYVFADPDNGISFKIENDKINFTAVPYYHFLRIISITPLQYDYANDLTEPIRVSKQVNNISPAIFNCAEKTAQWAAFFRLVKYQYPDAWYDFIMQIKPKLTDARYIPGQGPENDKYQYKFDSDNYDFETPRCLDFLDKEIEEDYRWFVSEIEDDRSQITSSFSKEQKTIYSSLTPLERSAYLSLYLDLDLDNELMWEKCNELSQTSRSVFLTLMLPDEGNIYLSFDTPQRELFDNLSEIRRNDLLSLSQEKRRMFFTLNPIQQEIWFDYTEAKRSQFLSLSQAERHSFILKDDAEIKRLLSTSQFEKFISLTENQKEIYFSIYNPYERNVYLSLNQEQRKYCDGLSVTGRNNFLSLSPKERDRVMAEETAKSKELTISIAPRVVFERFEPPLVKMIEPPLQIIEPLIRGEKRPLRYFSLTHAQRLIYLSLTSEEKTKYLSLSNAEREICDGLNATMRTVFLSIEPEQRMKYFLKPSSPAPLPKRSLRLFSPDFRPITIDDTE